MVGAMSSHCPGLRLSPWSGNKIPQGTVELNNNKKKGHFL